MKRIIDTFSITGSKRVYEAPIDRLIPEPADVIVALPHRAAMLAIELMACDEEFIRKHLRFGSTPPTKIAVWKVPIRHRIIQNAVVKLFGESFICL